MKNYDYALIDEESILLFTSFDAMKEWFTEACKDFTSQDVDEFFDTTYNAYDNRVYWTDRVAHVK